MARSSTPPCSMSISRSNSAAGGAFGNAMGTCLRQRLITRARLLQVVSIVGGLLLWELIASNYSHFILQSPSRVLVRLIDPNYRSEDRRGGEVLDLKCRSRLWTDQDTK